MIKEVKMKNIGYIRVSTDGQDNSVRTQREMIENYSKLKGIEIHDYFIDFGISGKNTIKREKYLELIRLVEDGQINTIITTSLSRWSRNTLDLLKSVEILKKHKVSFEVIKEQVSLNTPMGEFFVSILGSIYTLERQLTSERTKDVIQNKKKSGKVYSRVPYGYESQDGMLLENPLEQRVLRKIKRLRTKGDSYNNISTFLNRNKYMTKMGKKFTKENVYSLLKTDRKNIGFSSVNG
jgi:DNA invertase Pin-like site-specific DNA recombinase